MQSRFAICISRRVAKTPIRKTIKCTVALSNTKRIRYLKPTFRVEYAKEHVVVLLEDIHQLIWGDC